MLENIKYLIRILVFCIILLCGIVFEQVFNYYMFSKPTPIISGSVTEKGQVISEGQRVFNCVEQIYKLINDKNYTELYNLISPEYKEIEMNSLEILKNYIDSYYPKKVTPNYSSYIKTKDYYVIDINAFNNSYEPIEIIENPSPIYEKITLKMNKDNSFSFALNSFIYSKMIDKKIEKEYASVYFEKFNIYTDKGSIDLQINNKTDQTLIFGSAFDLELGYMNKSREISEKYNYYEDFTIPAYSSKKISVNFNLDIRNSELPQKITIGNIKTTNVNESLALLLEY